MLEVKVLDGQPAFDLKVFSRLLATYAEAYHVRHSNGRMPGVTTQNNRMTAAFDALADYAKTHELNVPGKPAAHIKRCDGAP